MTTPNDSDAERELQRVEEIERNRTRHVYIVTSGAYSDFGVNSVVERDTPVTAEESARLIAAYKSRDVVLGKRTWTDVLCSDFGFRRVMFREIWEGTVDGDERSEREDSDQ